MMAYSGQMDGYNNRGYAKDNDIAEQRGGMYFGEPSGPAAPPYNPASEHGGWSSVAQPSQQTTTGAPSDVARLEVGMEENMWAGNSLTDAKKIRARFIQKVYLILTAQLSVTIAIICWFIFHQPTRKWLQTHWYIYYIAYAVFLVLFIVLYCVHSVRRKTPGNYICLAVFTLAMSVMAGCLSVHVNTNGVLVCIGITAFVSISITLLVMQNKIDFTGSKCTAFLCVLVLVALATAVVFIILWFTVGYSELWWLHPLLGGLFAFIMCVVLAIDTHLIMGGGRHELSPEEYIVAALDLYIDIVYLFMILLCIMGGFGGGGD